MKDSFEITSISSSFLQQQRQEKQHKQKQYFRKYKIANRDFTSKVRKRIERIPKTKPNLA